jgi:integrase
MKQRFRLYRRGNGRYYAQDNITSKQESLGTTDRFEATRLLHAKNEAEQQPTINVHLARAYLVASDPAIATRTWQNVMDHLCASKQGAGRERWERATREKPFDAIRSLPLLQTRPDQLLTVMASGTVSTNRYLRLMHHCALAMSWLPCPIVNKHHWPPCVYKEHRAITWDEHRKLATAERVAERRAFLELCWHIGAAQIDAVSLLAEDIDWENRIITYLRRKTKTLCVLRFGDELAALLRQLPQRGPLFPNWSKLRSSDRAARFCKKCKKLGIQGVSLHSYRYAWAERAKTAGYPERFAQEALGHKSKAMHRAYAKHAKVTLPSLESYEQKPATSPASAPVGNGQGNMRT